MTRPAGSRIVVATISTAGKQSSERHTLVWFSAHSTEEQTLVQWKTPAALLSHTSLTRGVLRSSLQELTPCSSCNSWAGVRQVEAVWLCNVGYFKLYHLVRLQGGILRVSRTNTYSSTAGARMELGTTVPLGRCGDEGRMLRWPSSSRSNFPFLLPPCRWSQLPTRTESSLA